MLVTPKQNRNAVRADERGMLAFLKNLKNATRDQKGLSLVEVVVVVFVVAAVGFLAAPIVFPGDAKSPDAQLRGDMELLRQVMDLRMSSYDPAKTGGLGVEANIGVYAAYGQFQAKATLDANGKPAFYCLKGTHPSGLTLFLNSKDGAVTGTPTDPAACPGGAPAADPNQTQAPGTDTTPAPAPSQSGQPAATPIPESTESGATN